MDANIFHRTDRVKIWYWVTSIILEKDSNPKLRLKSPEICETLSYHFASEVFCLGALQWYQLRVFNILNKFSSYSAKIQFYILFSIN